MKKNKIIISHYNNLISKYGISKAGLGWRSDKQDKRFSIFLKYLSFKKKMVLDFGCGKNDFYNFLKKKKLIPKKIFCNEINPRLIEYIKKKYKDDKRVKLISNDLVKEKMKVNCDISISNGVHNFKYPKVNHFFIKDISYLFKISSQAVGISFLNNQVDFRQNNLYYHNYDKTINQIKKITHNLIIDQSFSKHETFVIINK